MLVLLLHALPAPNCWAMAELMPTLRARETPHVESVRARASHAATAVDIVRWTRAPCIESSAFGIEVWFGLLSMHAFIFFILHQLLACFIRVLVFQKSSLQKCVVSFSSFSSLQSSLTRV